MDPATLGIVLTVVFAVLGVIVKMIWSGFRDAIVKAILESSLGKLFDGLRTDIRHISEDVGHIKIAQDDIRVGHRQTTEEHNALRRRFDSHLDTAQLQQDDYKDFKAGIEEFVKRVTCYMRDHTHEAAPPKQE